jgi:hypothetical protein
MGCYKWFKSVVILGNTADVIHWTGRVEESDTGNLRAARSETAFLCRLENWFHKCFMQQRTFYVLRESEDPFRYDYLQDSRRCVSKFWSSMTLHLQVPITLTIPSTIFWVVMPCSFCGHNSHQGQDIFLFSVASRPALRPAQPPIPWILGAVSPGVKKQRCEALRFSASSAEI